MRMRAACGAVLLMCAGATGASGQESRFHAELAKEAAKLHEGCFVFRLQKIGSCVYTLATQSPLHVAFGSIAPKNGMGFGGAINVHFTPSENWRLSWNFDAVGATTGAWRAGSYFKAIRSAVRLPTPVAPGQGSVASVGIHEYPVLTTYAQIISLPRLTYYGLGANSPNQPSTFGMRETIVGEHVVWPIAPESFIAALALAFVGEANLRDVALRTGSVHDLSQVFDVFDETSAPGISAQPTTGQFAEGIRIRPELLAGYLRLDYTVQLHQYVASGDSRLSFRRWLLDLSHEIPLYSTSVGSRSKDHNGPNECRTNLDSTGCPPISRNRNGTITVRARMAKSQVGTDSAVPFYFQPTLGGSDINGDRALASYDDYRFRGPHVLLVQETLEHSIYGPVGAWVGLEQGAVATQHQKLTDADMKNSFGVGLTLRAGGFPAVLMSYSTGGSEGNHFAFTISTTLLGGGGRPSLW